MQTKTAWTIGAAVLALIVGTATAAAYITHENMKTPETEKVELTPYEQGLRDGAKTRHTKPRAERTHYQTASNVQPAAVHCTDDGNILGYVAGGALGGLLGNQVGKGNGKTVATAGGVVGGAYLGGKYLPLANQRCN